MGKQINYWMGYEDFLQIGQAALDCGCVIVKSDHGKSGYYDCKGEYIKRPECITKTYHKLVRIVKKAAPYTELTDTYISVRDEDYLQEKERKHKEDVSPQFLQLKLFQNYRLRI